MVQEFCNCSLVYFSKFLPPSDLLVFILGGKAKSLLVTLKKNYQSKKRDLKESNRSGTSAENVGKAQIAFSQYEYMNWLDDFKAKATLL